MPTKTAPPDSTERKIGPQDAVDWSVGEVILGLYEVRGILGEGGMGRVYKVHHRTWKVDLAVKAPKPEILQSAGGGESFEREAETWVNLGLHPNTVTCYYVRRVGRLPCVFAEFVKGNSLHEWISGMPDGSLPLYQGGQGKALARILDLAVQFAWGLEYAHENGLIHQDVKPANVMVGNDGTAKVTDFGLAVVRSNIPSPGEDIPAAPVPHGGPPGTPQYFSPEQSQHLPLTPHTDMWSWALCILEMFKGGRTWESGTVAMAALEEYLSAGSGAGSLPWMPVAVATLLKQCFHDDPAQRPLNMGLAAESLIQVYEKETGQSYHRLHPQAGRAMADSLNNRAVSLLDLNRKEEAEKLWAGALAAQPHHIKATYNRGLVNWRSARIDDASLLEQLVEAGRSHHGDWTGPYLQALVHLERDDARSALKITKSLHDVVSGDEALAEAMQTAQDAGGKCRRLLATLPGHTGNVNSISMNAKGSLALSGGDDGVLRLWSLTQKTMVRTLKSHRGSIRSVHLTPDGRFGLSGGGDFSSEDYGIRLWDTAANKVIRTFHGHEKTVNSVCVSPDRKTIISGSDDRTIKLWNTTSGECLNTLRGHQGAVLDTHLSPDGKHLFSAGADQTVKIWDMCDGHCLKTLKGHKGRVTTLAAGPAMRFLISGSSDQTMILWDLKADLPVKSFQGHRPT